MRSYGPSACPALHCLDSTCRKEQNLWLQPVCFLKDCKSRSEMNACCLCCGLQLSHSFVMLSCYDMNCCFSDLSVLSLFGVFLFCLFFQFASFFFVLFFGPHLKSEVCKLCKVFLFKNLDCTLFLKIIYGIYLANGWISFPFVHYYGLGIEIFILV